ncbi:MAG TPA: ImmA/IrrE family metallo-endopeptidase [Solirubrobacteraceae bacterium]|nr:ImmA/IrrE family metallo-endopeptidase [Solirubrobacteraceae bacterium]
MKQLSLLEQARTLEPGRSDVEHIERIAATTISELEERAPVDLRVVASYRGINQIEVVPMPMSGCLAPEDGGIRMLLNSRDSVRRRRFTGFHEVGHSFQPGYRTRRQYRCNSSIRPSSDSDPEALSDAAAAALLLPEAEFAPEVRESAFGLSSVIGLADRYEASVQATAYRFQRYWPEPTLMIVLEQGLRREERGDPGAVPKLRVVSTRPVGSWPFVPRNKSASEAGRLVRAENGEIIDEIASLDELGIDHPIKVRVSARAFTYRTGDGLSRRKVLAMYRQLGTKRRHRR